MGSNTKTIAKRARVGSRTPVVLTMKNCFKEKYRRQVVEGVT